MLCNADKQRRCHLALALLCFPSLASGSWHFHMNIYSLIYLSGKSSFQLWILNARWVKNEAFYVCFSFCILSVQSTNIHTRLLSLSRALYLSRSALWLIDLHTDSDTHFYSLFNLNRRAVALSLSSSRSLAFFMNDRSDVIWYDKIHVTHSCALFAFASCKVEKDLAVSEEANANFKEYRLACNASV